MEARLKEDAFPVIKNSAAFVGFLKTLYGVPEVTRRLPTTGSDAQLHVQNLRRIGQASSQGDQSI
jgi:hypothetical protein